MFYFYCFGGPLEEVEVEVGFDVGLSIIFGFSFSKTGFCFSGNVLAGVLTAGGVVGSVSFIVLVTALRREIEDEDLGDCDGVTGAEL